MKSIRRSPALLLLILSLFGCDKPKPKEQRIQGQVFILMQSGQTLKLSLVPIALLTEADLNYKISNGTAIAATVMKDLHDRKDAKAKEIEQIEFEMQEAESAQSVLRSQHSAAKERLAEMQNNFNAAWSRLNPQDREIATQSVKAQKEKVEQMQETGLKRKATIAGLTRNRDEAKIDLRAIQKTETDLAKTDPLFTTISGGGQTTTSDSDGNFQFVAPPGKYYLLAASDRMVGDKKEEYKWLVPVQKNPIFLNNATLYHGTSSLRFSQAD